MCILCRHIFVAEIIKIMYKSVLYVHVHLTNVFFIYRYTKAYRKQSYLVRKIKSSANLRILQDFGVASDNVVYSLSKKGRWELPKVLKEHILLDGFREHSTNVQLTENHKLRKTANCLGFYASKGPIKKAVPSKKRYFNVASVKKSSPNPPSAEKKDDEREEKEEEENLAEPEITVDVYHPSPMSSSITHNRKYIRPVHDPDLPANATNRKTRRRKRNRKFDLNLLENDYNDDFDDFFDGNDYVEGEESYDAWQETERPECFFTASDLLKSASRTKKIFDSGKRTNRKLNNEEISPKAKIVYLDRTNTTETVGDEGYQNESKPEGHKRSNRKALGFQKLMVPRKVVLATSETQPEYLKFVYGDKYIECQTFPRTFVLDVTEEVKVMMKQNALLNYKAFLMDLTTFIIFTFDIYTAASNAEEVFDVYLNANLKAETIEPSTLFDFFTSPLETVVNQAVSQLKLYAETQFERKNLHPTRFCQTVLDVWGEGKTTTVSEEELLEEALMESKQGNSLGETSFEALPPEVCFICYETMDENRPGMAMDKCGHWFCRGCWREHLLQQNGSRPLCPEFNCKKEVDFTTIVQILNISEVRKYLTRRKENMVQKQKKYCPNEMCGRLISTMTPHKQTNAVCDCGTKFCSDCFKFAHWPAPCEASQKYWEMLENKGINISQAEHVSFTPLGEDLVIQGKTCPKCHRFIEKEGGCYYMTCVCGVSFCWGCRGIHGYNHRQSELCNQHKNGDSFRTTKKRISSKQHLEENMRGESTLLKVAVSQRSERASFKRATLKKKINYFCQRFGTLGRKAVSRVAELLPVERSDGKNVLPNFEQFLRNMMNLHFEMRYLTEYTAVFAQQSNSSQKVSRMNCILERMDELASEIYSKLNQDASVDMVSLVSELLDIKNHCMNTVSALMRVIEK